MGWTSGEKKKRVTATKVNQKMQNPLTGYMCLNWMSEKKKFVVRHEKTTLFEKYFFEVMNKNGCNINNKTINRIVCRWALSVRARKKK